MTLRRAVFALITQVVSTASEQFRPGRWKAFTFFKSKIEAFFHFWKHDLYLWFIHLSYFKSYTWIRAAVLLWQHRRSDADRRFDRWQHPRQVSRLGLTSIQGAPTGAGVLPLALRCHKFLLLLPVVWPLPRLLQPSAFKRMSQLPTPKSWWDHS